MYGNYFEYISLNMTVTEEYSYHSWKVVSPWLDEPIYISFFKDYVVEVDVIRRMIRDRKLSYIIGVL
jgi:hypothetical protein